MTTILIVLGIVAGCVLALGFLGVWLIMRPDAGLDEDTDGWLSWPEDRL